MNKKLVFLMLILIASFGYLVAGIADFYNPPVISTTTYAEITGTVVTWTGTATGDDNVTDVINLGFTFPYCGGSYTQVVIASNGFVNIGTGTLSTLTNSIASTSAGYFPVIAPLWDDLHCGRTTAGGYERNSAVSYLMTGEAPNRTFTIQYKNANWYYSATTSWVDFQLLLHENGNFEMIYGPNSGVGPGTSATAHIGCNVGPGGTGNYYCYNPATTSFSTSVATNTTNYITPGTMFSFAAPLPQPPNPAVIVYPANGATSILTTANLSWASGGNLPTGYRVYLGTDNPPTNMVNGLDVGNVFTYDHPTDLNPTTMYYWQIVPYNGLGSAVGCPVWSFTTAEPPLSGIKTINPGGSGANNFLTFTAAINALNGSGVASTGVTFNVAAGAVFNEAAVMPDITVTGTATGPIVFQKAGDGANPLVTIPGTATTPESVFKILGGDYFTFDGIDIANATGSTATEYGIWFLGTTGNGCQYNTIQNCNVTLDKVNTATRAFYFSTVTGAPARYNTIQNNTITNTYYGIYFMGVSGVGNEDMNNTLNNNTFNNNAVYNIYYGYQTNGVLSNNTINYPTAAITSSLYGIYNYYSPSVNIFGNTINGGNTSGTYYNMYMYYCGSANTYNNTMTGNTYTGTGSFYGYYPYYCTGTMNFYNNTLTNLTSTSTGTIYGLYPYYGAATHNVYGNTVSNFNVKGTTYGIRGYASSTGYANIYNNKVYGLYYSGTGTHVISGIEIGLGSVNHVYNNMISDIKAPAGTAASTSPQSRGISVIGGTTNNIWNNTVYLDVVGTTLNNSSACIYYSSGTTNDHSNNIFVNKSVPGSSGRTVAFWKSATGLTNFATTMDKNIYYAGSPDATHLIFYNTTAYQTLESYLTYNAGKDQGSYTEDVAFVSNVSPYDLHIVPTSTVVNNNALHKDLVVTDIDGDVRNVTTPDIGADEGDFVAALTPPDPVTIVAPADGAQGINPFTVILDWNRALSGGDPDTYTVFIHNDIDTIWETEGIEIDASVSQFQPYSGGNPIILDFDTVYYWTVYPFSETFGGTELGDCPIWSFRTFDGVVTNPTPANGSTLTPAAPPTLTWSNLGGPATYLLTMGTTSGGNNVLDAQPVAAATYTHTSNWLYSTTYYWRVDTVVGETTVTGTEWTFSTQPDPRVILPYTENFDSTAPNMVIDGWVIGTPAKASFLIGAYSGANAMVTHSLTASYLDNQTLTATLQINTTGISRNINLEFYQKFYTETGWDAMVFEYSIDNGQSWTKYDAVVGTGTNFNTPTSFFWYNSTSTSGPVTPPKWSGSNSSTLYGDDVNGWIPSRTVIPYSLFGAAGNLSVRWRFGTDTSGTYEGFAIDDIHIWEEPPIVDPPNAVTMVAPSNTPPATNVNPRTVILVWDTPVGGGTVQMYHVYASTDAGNITGQHHWTIDAPTSQYSPFTNGATLLTHNTTWYWMIQPWNVAGFTPIGSCPVWSFTTSPQVVTSPTGEYGTVFTNVMTTKTFTITNNGTTPVDIDSIVLSGNPEFSVNTLPTLPVTLNELGTTTFSIDFYTNSVGTYSGNVQITDNLARNIYNIPLSATAQDVSGGYFMANSFQTNLPSYPTYEWIDISETGTTLSGLTDDSYSSAIPMGITFPFFGVNQTSVYVSSNGHLTFGTGSSTLGNTTIPLADAPNNMIAWFWDDMNPADSDFTDDWIKYQTIDDKFIISFYKLPEYYSSVDVNRWLTAQVILYSSGKIKIQYAAKGSTMTMVGNTVGIENSTGTMGVQYCYGDEATLVGGSVFGPAGEPLALAFHTDVMGLGDGPATLDAPIVVLSETLIGLHLQWDAVPNANSYLVYGSEDPYGTYTMMASVAGTSFDMPYALAPAIGFVKVIASTAAPIIRVDRNTQFNPNQLNQSRTIKIKK